MNSIWSKILILQAFLVLASSFDSRNVVFVVISQVERYHASVANRLKQNIEEQALQIEKHQPKIHLTHEDFPLPGAWTVIPLLEPILQKYNETDVRWVVFLESSTAVRYNTLLELLKNADEDKNIMWIGYPLNDVEPTIIHHFAYYEELEEHGGLVYPNFASGFAMRMKLLDALHKQIINGERKLEADFSIDPAFELAQLVYGLPGTQRPGPLLTADLRFCVIAADKCATYPRHLDTCKSSIPENAIFFAVKTWSGFHSTRAKVVKKTWGRYVSNLLFFSDKSDSSLPSIDTGIPNSKTGHCAKSVAILKYMADKVKNMPHIKWIFLADDDTILGVQRLCEVLSCYRGGEEWTVLGERYGYGYGKNDTAHKGFDYITGGGGVAFSVSAARGLSTCECPHTAPDDMSLGGCVRTRGRTLTHHHGFHQARPQDYPREVLSRDRPVSFHRHSSPDPLTVYATWFHHDDLTLTTNVKDEL